MPVTKQPTAVPPKDAAVELEKMPVDTVLTKLAVKRDQGLTSTLLMVSATRGTMERHAVEEECHA